VKVRTVDDQPVEIGEFESGIGQRPRGKIGDLFKMEHARRGRIFFRFVLSGPNNRRPAFQSHDAGSPR